MEVQVRATCGSYISQLKRSLGMLVKRLETALEGARNGEGRRIGELTEQVTELDQLKDKAKKLR